MVQNENKKIILHSCCGICSGYPISLLKEMGYSPIVYFCNPNLNSEDEFNKRLKAQEKVCQHFNVELFTENYSHRTFLDFITGLENEPEKGKRCDKCIELRLLKTAEFALKQQIKEFTTSLPISPHKNFNKIKETGDNLAKKYNLDFIGIDFKKKDGFLKTNQISKELNLYRQNFCGCEFSIKS